MLLKCRAKGGYMTLDKINTPALRSVRHSNFEECAGSGTTGVSMSMGVHIYGKFIAALDCPMVVACMSDLARSSTQEPLPLLDVLCSNCAISPILRWSFTSFRFKINVICCFTAGCLSIMAISEACVLPLLLPPPLPPEAAGAPATKMQEAWETRHKSATAVGVRCAIGLHSV